MDIPPVARPFDGASESRVNVVFRAKQRVESSARSGYGWPALWYCDKRIDTRAKRRPPGAHPLRSRAAASVAAAPARLGALRFGV